MKDAQVNKNKSELDSKIWILASVFEQFVQPWEK